MELRTLLVDAFTDEPLAGNAAGVVPDADDLTENQLQAIARELAVSETVFLRESEAADRRLRYVTPTQEVDLCGHATIAAHAHLLADGAIEPGSHSIETNVGVLDVEVEADGTVWMTQNSPTIREVDVGYDEVGAALGIDPATMQDVGEELPIAVASTGLPFLVVPVNFLDSLGSADPDDQAVRELCAPHDAAGVYVFTFDALDTESALHGRAFTAPVGISEDPVTGTASGAVGAYLDRFGAFDATPSELIFEQGHYLDRPGRVRVRPGDPVQVGGVGTTALDGTLAVPDDDDEEIIEA